MSFSIQCKSEVLFVERESCCVSSLLYGILSFAKSFSKNNITMWLSNNEIADRVLKSFLLAGSSDSDFTTEIKNSATVLKTTSKQTNQRILLDYGYTGDEPNYRIIGDNFFCEECFGAFAAGAFISCGTIVDPECGYHLEFSTHKKRLFEDLMSLFEQKEFFPKSTDRGYSKVMYFKDSTHIEDVLSFMGANDAMFELVNHKIVKDIRNSVNRRINCESANIDKLVKASSKDVELFSGIEDYTNLLSNELLEVINLRLKNPEISLVELGKLCEPKLSKSGINHRLAKARTLVKELKEKKLG